MSEVSSNNAFLFRRPGKDYPQTSFLLPDFLHFSRRRYLPSVRTLGGTDGSKNYSHLKILLVFLQEPTGLWHRLPPTSVTVPRESWRTYHTTTIKRVNEVEKPFHVHFRTSVTVSFGPRTLSSNYEDGVGSTCGVTRRDRDLTPCRFWRLVGMTFRP